jgi:hypothetical protein
MPLREVRNGLTVILTLTGTEGDMRLTIARSTRDLLARSLESLLSMMPGRFVVMKSSLFDDPAV